jgi:carbamoyl-phosphate synthase large subunit
MQFQLIATSGTAAFLKEHDIEVTRINKVREGRPHVVDAMKDGAVDLVLNTTDGTQSISDSYSIRRTALLDKIPYSTTLSGAKALVEAMAAMRKEGLMKVKSLQEYHS